MKVNSHTGRFWSHLGTWQNSWKTVWPSQSLTYTAQPQKIQSFMPWSEFKPTSNVQAIKTPTLDCTGSVTSLQMILLRGIKTEGGIGSIHESKYIYTTFWLESLKEGDHLEDIGIDGKKILKWADDWITWHTETDWWWALVTNVVNVLVP